MRLRVSEPISLEYRAHQFIIKAKHFIQQLWIFNMIWLLVALKGLWMCYQLVFFNIFEGNKFIFSRSSLSLRWTWILATVSIVAIEESSCSWRSRWSDCFIKWWSWILWIWDTCSITCNWFIFFQFFKFYKYLWHLSLSLFFFQESFWQYKCSLFVYKVWCTCSSRDLAINSNPTSFKVALYILKSVKSTHFLRLFGDYLSWGHVFICSWSWILLCIRFILNDPSCCWSCHGITVGYCWLRLWRVRTCEMSWILVWSCRLAALSKKVREKLRVTFEIHYF